MSSIVIKIIRGRRYAYEHCTWREGKRVRSETRYIGPVDGPQRRPKRPAAVRRSRGVDAGWDEVARITAALERAAERTDAEQRARYGETAVERQEQERQEHLAALHDRFGFRVDTAPPAPAALPAKVATEESPSDDAEGQGIGADETDEDAGGGQNN